MFNRQWFPPNSQQGLCEEAVELEMLIRKKQFQKAIYTINNTSLADEYKARQGLRIARLNKIHQNHENKIVCIYFSGFWPDMDPSRCQLLDFIKISLNELQVTVLSSPLEADIIIESCYGNVLNQQVAPGATWILFLGENVRPNFTRYDLAITSDNFAYRDRNIYLPLWMLEIDWFKRLYKDRSPMSTKLFHVDAVWDYSLRKNKVLFIGNNNEPVRISVIEGLKKHGIQVDLFGSHTKPIANKIEFARQYKIMISMENSFFPGYITEKAVHPYLSGCHAIRFGDTSTLGSSELLKRCFDYYPNPISPDSEIVSWVLKIFDLESDVIFRALFDKSTLYDKFYYVINAIRTSLAFHLPS